jgi:hypothetical protein
MYSIQYVKADQWQVMDESDQAVFVGNQRQVEDWLDHQENLRRQLAPQVSIDSLARSLRQLVDRLAGRLSRHVERQGSHAQTHRHALKQ